MTRISVTADDIKCGAVRSPCNCPVALAIQRHVRGRVYVGSQTARIVASDDNSEVILNLPHPVDRWIGFFDYYGSNQVEEGRAAEPIDFELDIPASLLA